MPPPDDERVDAPECEHGMRRRECASCLAEWVDGMLDDLKWRRREARMLRGEIRRLRRRLAENGVENPS